MAPRTGKTKGRKAALAKRSTEIVHSPGGPPVGHVTRVRGRNARESHPLINADVNRIGRAFVNAFTGNPAELHDLIDDARDRDNRLDAVCRTRMLAIQSRRFEVKAADESAAGADGKAIAKAIERNVREIKGWRTRVGEIADGVLRAPSVSEIEWHVNRRSEHSPRQLHWVHPNRIRFGDDLGIELTEPGVGSQRGKPIGSYGPDKFVVHAPNAGRAAYLPRRGVIISCLMPALTKRYGYQWLMQAAERFGQPAPVIKLPPGSTQELVEEALEALRQLTADWQMVLTAGMELEVLPGSTGQVDGAIQQRIIDLANTSFAIAILGQNLTTEVGGNGSRAATEAHDVVRQDILAADLAELDDTITEQVVEPIARYNWPGTGPFVYETELQPKQPKEVFAYHISAGVLTLEEIRESVGRPGVPSGPLYLPPAVTAQGTPPPGGAAPAGPLALDQMRTTERETETAARFTWPSHSTTATASSRTSMPSTHPLASALRQRWDAPAR